MHINKDDVEIKDLIKQFETLRNTEGKNISYEGDRRIFYPHYELREEYKDIAWKIIKKSIRENNFHRAAFFLIHGVIDAHYWRAREHLESYNEKDYQKIMKLIRGKKYYRYYRLEIDHYTHNWLWANGDRTELFPKELVEYIEEHYSYSPKECKYLPKGASIYRDFIL